MKFRFSILFFILFSCHSDDYLTGKYESFWGDTYFKVELKQNNQFKYKIEEHMTFDNFEGTYSINQDTLILENEKMDGMNNKFLILDSGCLVELETGYDYCKRIGEDWETNRYPIDIKSLN